MNLTLVKLIATPTLIGLVSLAGRRWGHAISGWIVALPLTTGPIVFFLALSHGPAFAAETAAGALAGCLSLAAFTVAYARLTVRWPWVPTLVVASLAFFLTTALLRGVLIAPFLLWVGALLAFALSLRLLPRTESSAAQPRQMPALWDIPLRMVIATGFVVVLTAFAAGIGPHLAGLLAPFPLFTAILAAFAQHHGGGAAAVSVLRGLLLGLFSYASFMFTLAVLLVPAGIILAFPAALVVVFVLQGLALRSLRLENR